MNTVHHATFGQLQSSFWPVHTSSLCFVGTYKGNMVNCGYCAFQAKNKQGLGVHESMHLRHVDADSLGYEKSKWSLHCCQHVVR
jgi:biotin synthase-like enzyme